MLQTASRTDSSCARPPSSPASPGTRKNADVKTVSRSSLARGPKPPSAPGSPASDAGSNRDRASNARTASSDAPQSRRLGSSRSASRQGPPRVSGSSSASESLDESLEDLSALALASRVISLRRPCASAIARRRCSSSHASSCASIWGWTSFCASSASSCALCSALAGCSTTRTAEETSSSSLFVAAPSFHFLNSASFCASSAEFMRRSGGPSKYPPTAATSGASGRRCEPGPGRSEAAAAAARDVEDPFAEEDPLAEAGEAPRDLPRRPARSPRPDPPARASASIFAFVAASTRSHSPVGPSASWPVTTNTSGRRRVLAWCRSAGVDAGAGARARAIPGTPGRTPPAPAAVRATTATTAHVATTAVAAPDQRRENQPAAPDDRPRVRASPADDEGDASASGPASPRSARRSGDASGAAAAPPTPIARSTDDDDIGMSPRRARVQVTARAAPRRRVGAESPRGGEEITPVHVVVENKQTPGAPVREPRTDSDSAPPARAFVLGS